MKQLLPFLLFALASFGATHIVLAARAPARAPPPAASLTSQATRPITATLGPEAPRELGKATSMPGCRAVRVVYAGSVRPPAEVCPPRS